MNCLHDHLNAEIVSGMITSKQDCMDYLTWTFLYRRIMKNPSYYGFSPSQGKSLDEFFSDKIEFTLRDLELAHCVEIGDDNQISPLTPGIIASYYYLSYRSVDLFHDQIQEESTIQSLLNVLTQVAEYDELPVRHNEELLNEEMASQVRHEVDEFSYEDPHTKANLLLQAHFSHLPVPIIDYKTDTMSVLDQAVRILQAMIDVSFDQGFLKTTCRIITLLQMIVQGCWDDQNPLALLPSMDSKAIEILTNNGYATLSDVTSNVPKVCGLLKSHLSEAKSKKLSKELPLFPNIQLKVIQSPKSAKPGEAVSLSVSLQRLSKERKFVFSPRFPKRTTENWFLLLADMEYDEVLSMRRVPLRRKMNCTLEFITPDEPGEYKFTVLLISGSYFGVEVREEVTITVK